MQLVKYTEKEIYKHRRDLRRRCDACETGEFIIRGMDLTGVINRYNCERRDDGTVVLTFGRDTHLLEATNGGVVVRIHGA